MRKPCGPGVVALVVATLSQLVGTGVILGREERSVFHGLPTEPESGFKPVPAKNPIALSRAWVFDDFRSPLAGTIDGDAGRIVAADRSGDLAALNVADGGVLWRVQLGEPLAIGPALEGGRVLQGTTRGSLVALDAADGRIVWRSDLGAAPVAPPLSAAGRLLMATEEPALVALDPATGARTGWLPLPGLPVAPGFGEGVVVVGTDHGMLVALDPATLAVRWRRYLRQPVSAPPLVHRHRVYAAVADRSIRCLRLSSGHQLWRQRTGSIATASLVTAGDYVYLLSWDNDIYVVLRRSGHMAARVHLDHRLSLDAVRGKDYLFVAPFTEGSVVALSLPSLGMAGRFNLDAPGEWFTTPPVLAGERVAVGSGRDAGRILALDWKPAPPPKAKDGTGDSHRGPSTGNPPAATPGG